MDTITASRSPFRDTRSAGTLSLMLLVCWFCWFAAVASAQRPPIHYFQSADMAPGAVGAGQLMRGGPLPGYFQPVRITAPAGAEVALSLDGIFDVPQPNPICVGLLVGRVYRLKITNIPNYAGSEVFPSIEIINRLFPPLGQETRFPIPVELTREELDLAMRGHYVTRVIYLEDPRNALPHVEAAQQQRYFDVGPRQDPLRVADELGRPMAILRIGSRVPESDVTTGRFLFDSPPWMRLPDMTSAMANRPARQARATVTPHVPRLPVDSKANTVTAGAIRRDDR